ncbi:MAG: energy transducer TonB [Candidatus Sulfotelmatobacter sp.]
MKSRCYDSLPPRKLAETVRIVLVSLLVMGQLRKATFAYLLLSAISAAQGTPDPPRIICTPPTLKIVKMVRPTLPLDAKPSDVVGIAAVEVEIDKAGMPSSIKVLKGNPVAANAVVMAVKQWRRRPLKLNGVAVEAVTTIAVNFEAR